MNTKPVFPLMIAQVNTQLFHGDVVSVTLPGIEGELTILKGHLPIVTILKKGTITVRTESDVKEFLIPKGVLEVSGGLATVLVQAA